VTKLVSVDTACESKRQRDGRHVAVRGDLHASRVELRPLTARIVDAALDGSVDRLLGLGIIQRSIGHVLENDLEGVACQTTSYQH